jgi:hypothetical protein
MHGYAADAVHTWFHGGTVYSTTPRNWGSGRRPYCCPAAIRPLSLLAKPEVNFAETV